MPFDKKYYKQVKKFMDHQVSHVNMFLAEKYKNDPFGWAATFLPLIADCVYRHDYEAAKAGSDAIREFLNKFLPEDQQITPETKLNLPEIKQIDIHGIVCFVNPDNPFEGGHAEYI